MLSSWRVWLPSAILIAVAAVQITLTRTVQLSPWKGGGFGMFATLDAPAFRRVRLFVEAPERAEEITIAPSLADLATRTATLPTVGWMQRLARAAAAREHRQGRPATRVRVEVSAQRFAVVGFGAHEVPLRSLTLDVDGPR